MRIYISYRRADAAAQAGRLSDALTLHLGEASVVRDVQFLQAGAEFRVQMARAAEQADAMLVLIGPHWLQASDAEGQRRIDAPDDGVRGEIAQALNLGKRIVPVLVGGALMPQVHQLPADIAALSRLAALALSEERWGDGIKSLLSVLQGEPPSFAPQRPASPAPVAAATPHPKPARSIPSVVWRTLLIGVVVAMGLLGVWLLAPLSGGGVPSISLPPGPTPTPNPVPPPDLVTGAAGVDRPWWPVILALALIIIAVMAWRYVQRRRAARNQASANPANAGAVPPSAALPAPPAMQKVDVFVSHAGADHELAQAIVTQLEAERLRCWIAPRDIPAGVRSWAGPIVEAIARSRVFVVIISSSSNGSIEVLREVTLANEEKVPFMPVRIDSSPLSADFRYFFATAQRMEASGWPREQLLSHINSGVGVMMKGSAA